MALFESTKYEVLKKSNQIEIREYQTFYLASTTTRLDQNQSNGFSNVFNYISGENESKQKISMTVPVITSVVDDNLVTGFVVPSKLSGNIPKPTNANVFIEEIKNGNFIALKFRGVWTTKNFDEHDKILLKYISDNGLKIISKRYILRYQPPFVPSFLRRNEVLYRIENYNQINK